MAGRRSKLTCRDTNNYTLKRNSYGQQDRAEGAYDRAVECYVAEAQRRGESVDVTALATGQGLGRTMQDVIDGAVAMADRQDAIDAARAKREAENPQPLHVFVGEPTIVASPTRRALLNRSRHWRAWRERIRQAEAERKALETANDITLARPVGIRHG
jgi:hypothetical protein